MSKFRRFGRLLAATTVSATIVVGAPVAFAQEDHIVDFSVTNITDFHGHLSSQKPTLLMRTQRWVRPSSRAD